MMFQQVMQAFSARRADIAESLLQKERQQAAELQAEVAELQLLLEEQAWRVHHVSQHALQPHNPSDLLS